MTEFGKPHSAKGFGNWFKKRCREAGLEGLSAHGLRKLGAQRCAEAGATEHQLMALFGWTNPQQAAVYTKKANRAKLESQAAPLLQGQNRNNDLTSTVPAPPLKSTIQQQSVPLFPAVASGETIRLKTS
ncbi:MAG: tyrosine-type recombinase/integrase [Stellaceae bacterium]